MSTDKTISSVVSLIPNELRTWRQERIRRPFFCGTKEGRSTGIMPTVRVTRGRELSLTLSRRSSYMIRRRASLWLVFFPFSAALLFPSYQDLARSWILWVAVNGMNGNLMGHWTVCSCCRANVVPFPIRVTLICFVKLFAAPYLFIGFIHWLKIHVRWWRTSSGFIYYLLNSAD